MSNKIIFSVLFACFHLIANVVVAQQKVTISGRVQDLESGEKLPGASVFIEDLNKGAVSNRFGFYSFSVLPGQYSIEYRFVGYKPFKITIDATKDTTVVALLQSDLLLDEVTVKARHQNPNMLNSSEIGIHEVPIELIRKTPVIAGENDVLKTLQYLPGIKQSQEGTAGINVRGGSPDQNLILLDGVPVYNVNHLFGFLSVFNSDALSQVKMYKGGIPARYGGRLASVLDIGMKEGNRHRDHGVFSISPVAGRLTLEGPIKKEKASFMLSGRRTFLDLPLRLYQNATDDLQGGYFFHDFNGKANWEINEKNHVYVSAYLGKDKYFTKYKEFGDKTNYGYSWGNITSVLRWNRKISSKLFGNATAYYSHFNNLQKIKSKDRNNYLYLYSINSKLDDYSLALDFDWYPALNYSVKFGVKSSWQVFNPQVVKSRDGELNDSYSSEQKNPALTNAAYLESDFQLLKQLRINAGVRADWYHTEDNSYYYLQPRFSANYKVSPLLSVKASYTEMSQFLHLLSNSSIGMPTDLWVPSTRHIKPQQGWQASVGAYLRPNAMFDFSVEAYYKEMDHVIRFKDGVSFFDSRQENWEEEVTAGSGNAYGVEWLLKKNIGKLTGWIGYTLSWSNRKFAEINKGRAFPYRYDKRHDLSILGEYRIADDGTDSKTFTFGFTYNTGYAVSIPDIKHHGQNIITDKGDHFYLGLFDYFQNRITYSTPNNYRMPNFHHFDIGYHLNRKLSKSRSRTWSFSVYNVYNRLNPWYFYNDRKDGKLKQVSIFPIIPSVSFTYSW
ncbi:TonB-dependent receptor [Sunxiuqinia elliptica]|uniref:Outer membrane receptor protein involved in Fe transport n=1 Tax=Sunxiuqinia elliptica TaxID=655355 RepID=A0A4V3BYP1_9BACT|nr:TonB-dependent receptor [Sunxiuqinia elliptica]TDO03369.1 outer membrane receptor protein involved in Fe transport [Sunxiuqinia elliptica]TDO59566.1 outer membrane receptor protein involved in Fe transport [Sunxiuqinia elliptica]